MIRLTLIRRTGNGSQAIRGPLVNLDPTIESEIKKVRPCLIITPNEMNKYINTVIIAPMTTVMKKYPTRVNVKFMAKNGQVALDQLRCIDKRRLVKNEGFIGSEYVYPIKRTLREMLID